MGFVQKREIKFRDYDFDTKKVRHFNLDSYDKNEHDSYGNITEFTGIKDSQDIEIFEGDIMQDRFGAISKVVYVDEQCRFMQLSKVGYSPLSAESVINDKDKVIGNIYENPDLLPNITIQ